MFVIKNNSRFPVVIRDLNYHIQGNKSVDLDLIFRRETAENSVDLKNIIKCKKVDVLNKDNHISTKQNVVKDQEAFKAAKPAEIAPSTLIELVKEIKSMKDLLSQGATIQHVQSNNTVEVASNYDEATKKKIADLQARSLAQKDNEVEKNFENIGKVTEKKDSGVGNMLDILDSLNGNE
jgi:hypothetical protein